VSRYLSRSAVEWVDDFWRKLDLDITWKQVIYWFVFI